MKLFKSPLRRTTAILAGAFLGMAGAVALAAPASAHHPTISVDSSCIDESTGKWIVNWSVSNSESDLTATLDKVEFYPPNRSTLEGISTTSILPVSGEGPLKGVQTIGLSANASLSVTAHWIRNGHDIVVPAIADVKRPKQKCVPTSPSPSPSESSPSPSPSESTPTPSPSVSTPPSETPTPSASPSATPIVPVGNNSNLPVTGAATGSIAAGAAVLLAIGGGLFFMARRRKLKFTA